MAPEQLTDGEITPYTDIYSFGLVIYEMLTGLTPFQAETPFLSALKRLQEEPVAPSVHVENFDLNWEQSILRCLDREPERRFASALDVVKSLQGEEVPLPPKAPEKSWTRHLAWALPLVLVVAIAATWLVTRQTAPPPPSETPAEQVIEARPSVAVLGFRNTTGNEEMGWISTALAEMLTTELSLGEAFRTVPGETVARATLDIGLDELQTLGPETLGVLRRILGSELVVLGSYTVLPDGEQIRLDVRAQNAETGETAATSTQNGTTSELFRLISDASAELRGQLGAGAASAEEVASAQASLPTDSVAARYYSEGLEKLRAFDTRGGIELLEKAVEADSDSPMAHLSLANAWSSLGYDGKARAAAERALELSDELPRQDRLRIEAVDHKLSYQHDEAVRIAQSLWTLFPDNRAYGLTLAQAQMRAGQPHAALETVAELRRLPPPENEHPRIDLAEARAAAGVGDAQRQLEAARRAATKGADLGARLLMADAKVELADALTNLGRYEEAIAAAEEAEAMYMEADAPSLVFQATLRLANALFRTDRAKQALGLWQQVLDVAREIGNRGLEATALNNIASARLQNGDLDGARQRLGQVLEINRETGSLEGQAQALNNLSITDQMAGDLSSAIDRLQQSLALRREIGDRRGEALNLKNIANVYYGRGELAEARANLEEALAISRQVQEPILIADTLHSLGDVLIWEGDLSAARTRHSEALEIRTDIGASAAAGHSRFALAGLRVEEARLGQAEPAEAIAETEAAVEWATSTGHPGITAAAYQMLADAALIAGETERAATAIEAASELPIRDISTKVFHTATAARVQAAQGNHDAAIAALEELVAATAKGGIPGNELEARYALADALRLSGRLDDARRTLERLQRDAAARGFHLAARRASQMLEVIDAGHQTAPLAASLVRAPPSWSG
jgi:tetratricopeptide (TPR) repeat protein